MDGVIYYSNLNSLGYDKNWLDKKMKENNLTAKNTFIFVVDESGNIYCQAKEKNN